MVPRTSRRLATASTLSLLVSFNALAVVDPNDLFDLSIEELVNLEVTSVNRKAERLADTSSAVYVITRDDIERHGIRSIPEALRLAPGVSVLQIDANKWSVGTRGFAGRFTNNLLVMMDGRLLYTPSFSGVYWDTVSTLIEEVERIEVIRGPGAVVWGTNAVNGVINIITASSDAGDGGDIVAGRGPEGGSFGGIRYSNDLSDLASYRVFAYYNEGDGNTLPNDEDSDDDWDLIRASLRADREYDTGQISLTVEGFSGTMGSTRNVYDIGPLGGVTERLEPAEAEISGAFALVRWSANSIENRSTSGQVYVDHSERDEVLWGEDRTTYSAEIQHQRSSGRNELNLGGSLRITKFDFEGSDRLMFFGDFDSNRVVSAYIQNTFWLSADHLSITSGLKLENNDYSPNSIEWMPSLRLLWKPAAEHTVWTAVTRAVRSPSAGDLGAEILDLQAPLAPFTGVNPFPLPLRQATTTTPEFDSTPSISIEAGIRGQIGKRLSYDLALFTVDYKGVRSVAIGDTVCSPSGTSVAIDPSCLFSSTQVIAYADITNNDDASSNGFELAIDWQARDDLRIRTSVSVANDDQNTDDPLGLPLSSSYPPIQASFQALWSPGEDISIAAFIRHVGEIESQLIDDYWQANLHVRWTIEDRWIASLGVRNALEDNNVEYRSDTQEIPRISIENSVFANLRYSF